MIIANSTERFLIRKLLLLALLTCGNAALAQRILNPSFEGTPQQNVPPDHWTPCHRFSTPDTQPGFWEVTKIASDGSTFISLVTRGNQGPFANENEDIQTELVRPVVVGETFTFDMDLSFSENWGHFIGFGSDFLNYDTPAKLKVFGGLNSCEKTELLWESPVIEHTEWKTYLISITPQTTDVAFLIFQADFSTGSPEFGNIQLDHIRPCSFEVEWVSDTVICENEPLVLDVTIPNGTYEWQDGTVSPLYTIQNAGNYSVVVSNGCATEKFELEVATRNCLCDTATPIQTVPFDSTKCRQVEITLDATTPGGSYVWNTGSNDPTLPVKNPGLYSVEVSNSCESKTFDFLIETVECACNISAPNVFTPNGDGLNDVFEITGTSDIARYNLKVFNRAGVNVYQSNQLDAYWDGYSNRNELPAGIYYYTVEVMCIQGNAILENSFNGWITIMK
ncbi:MAG: gliding motility-associated C-terminal domain-containing protein [Bacteroidota bacterium]